MIHFYSYSKRATLSPVSCPRGGSRPQPVPSFSETTPNQPQLHSAPDFVRHQRGRVLCHFDAPEPDRAGPLSWPRGGCRTDWAVYHYFRNGWVRGRWSCAGQDAQVQGDYLSHLRSIYGGHVDLHVHLEQWLHLGRLRHFRATRLFYDRIPASRI